MSESFDADAGQCVECAKMATLDADGYCRACIDAGGAARQADEAEVPDLDLGNKAVMDPDSLVDADTEERPYPDDDI